MARLNLRKEEEEVGIEVDTKQDHEDGHDPPDGGRKPVPKAGAVPKAVSMVKRRHAAQQQEYHLQHGECRMPYRW